MRKIQLIVIIILLLSAGALAHDGHTFDTAALLILAILNIWALAV